MPFRGGDRWGLQYCSEEKKREIINKSIEARKKNKEERLQLQKCMAALLELPVRTKKQEELLRDFGFKKEHDNKTLLMVSLFQKGLTGDVQAIREITDMMEKLDMYKENGKVTGNVVINVLPVGKAYEMTEEDEREIKEAEKEGYYEEDEDLDDWGLDVYEG